MAKTILIVEGESDKYIFEAILRFIQKQDDIEVVPDNVQEIEFILKADESDPLNPTALIKALDNLTSEFSKENITRVGIVRDMDLNTLDNRILLVNNAIKGAY